MRIRKFLAKDMTEALAQVKRELGPDAMIVATRPVKRGLIGSGIEVTAAIDAEEETSTAATGVGPTMMSNAPSALTAASAHVAAPMGLSDNDMDRIESLVAPLRSELRSLRAIVRESNDNRWGEELKNEMKAMRHSFASSSAHAHSNAALPDLKSLMGANLAAPSQARIIALVGPTGVGKTTTIGKLAARAALVERRAVALITLDTYRVGGEEQLRTFADLIGVPVERVDDPRRLARTVDRMIANGAEQIYIDTAGRSPRDREAIEALAEALEPMRECEIHLTLAATSTPAMVDAAINHYRVLGISRLLFTKVDEALELGELVRAPARSQLPVTYLGCGQRVPEDLEVATNERLFDLARNGFDNAEVAA